MANFVAKESREVLGRSVREGTAGGALEPLVGGLVSAGFFLMKGEGKLSSSSMFHLGAGGSVARIGGAVDVRDGCAGLLVREGEADTSC